MADQKNETPGAVAAADRAQGSGQSKEIVPKSKYGDKRYRTLQAEAALAGVGLHRTDTGFLVTRWGLVRELRTIDDAARFLTQMGVG